MPPIALPPLDFQVRPATVQDVGGMTDLWLTRHAGDRIDSMVGIAGEIGKARRGEGRLVLVALHQARVVAYGRARLWSEHEVAGHRACPSGWWLCGSLVTPPLRRRGIGRALMQQRLATLGGTVHSKVDLDNRASLAWHHACGFVELTRDFTSPGTGNPETPMALLRWQGAPWTRRGA